MNDALAARLAAAALPVTAEELTELARIAPALQALVDRLYALPEARYVDPAQVFRAADVSAEPWD